MAGTARTTPELARLILRLQIDAQHNVGALFWCCAVGDTRVSIGTTRRGAGASLPRGAGQQHQDDVVARPHPTLPPSLPTAKNARAKTGATSPIASRNRAWPHGFKHAGPQPTVPAGAAQPLGGVPARPGRGQPATDRPRPVRAHATAQLPFPAAAPPSGRRPGLRHAAPAPGPCSRIQCSAFPQARI